MTVAELIEELQKYPAHHAVVAEYQSDFNPETGMVIDVGSICDARADAIGRSKNPTVILSIKGYIE